jgi:hypothetical protein
MAELQTVNEIHEQQIAQVLRDCTEEERQFLQNKFTQHRTEYLHHLKDFQSLVNDFVRDRKTNKKAKLETLYKNLEEKHLSNEKLDFDEVMKEFIESEYDNEDHFWVTSDDPALQQAIGTEEYLEALDDETRERLVSSKGHHQKEFMKKKIDEKLEEEADQNYEYDNPVKLTRQQAIKIFTERSKVSKQFQCVKSGLAKNIILGYARTTGAVGNKQLDDDFYKKVNKDVVKQAITQLKLYAEKKFEGVTSDNEDEEEDEKKNTTQQKKQLLLEPDEKIQLFVDLFKPAESSVNPFTIPLKHHLYQPDEVNILVIVRDSEKQAFKDLIAGEEYAENTKVLTLSKLQTEYKEYNKQRFLSKHYDLLFVEKYVLPAVHSNIGKKFYRTSKKMPQAVTFENLKEYINNYITGTKVNVTKGNYKFSCDAAKLHLSVAEIAENVYEILKVLPHKIPDGSPTITKILLKTQNSPSLPVFYSPNTEVRSKSFKAEKKFNPSKEEQENLKQLKENDDERKQAFNQKMERKKRRHEQVKISRAAKRQRLQEN